VLTFHFGPYSVQAAMLTGPTLQANVWTHVAVTRQGATFRMFVNGTQVASANSSSPGISVNVPTALGDYFLGTDAFGARGAASFAGLMDQVRITTVSRYNANFVPSADFPAR
jgi:hypothetical protein